MVTTPANGARWLLMVTSGKARVALLLGLLLRLARNETAAILCRVNSPAQLWHQALPPQGKTLAGWSLFRSHSK